MFSILSHCFLYSIKMVCTTRTIVSLYKLTRFACWHFFLTSIQFPNQELGNLKIFSDRSIKTYYIEMM